MKRKFITNARNMLMMHCCHLGQSFAFLYEYMPQLMFPTSSVKE